MHASQLDQLFRDHHQAVLSVTRRQVRHLSDDQVEDAMMTTWQRLAAKPDDHLIGNPRQVRSYLITCAVREAWHLARDQAELTLDDDTSALDDGTSRSGRSHAILHVETDRTDRRAIARLELAEILEGDTLTDDDRRSVTAQLIGLSYKQECAATGRTYTNVNRHRTEGRAKLRAQLA